MTDQTLAPPPQPSAKLLTFEIGQRVRRLRRKHGLTRRQLSESTAISERYLGQLENGQANASINILHKIATRFGGVKRAHAVKAGTELRVIVDTESTTDDNAFSLSKTIARAIEKEVNYPGQIKVQVIRETRSVRYAV